LRQKALQKYFDQRFLSNGFLLIDVQVCRSFIIEQIRVGAGFAQ